MHRRECHAAESETELVLELAKIRENLVDDVMRIGEPLFMLFDFATFGRPVYEDLVTKFVQGQVT
jgi:hypothetical protein